MQVQLLNEAYESESKKYDDGRGEKNEGSRRDGKELGFLPSAGKYEMT